MPRLGDTTIPYTHWAYFTDKAAAEACGRELDLRFDALAAVDPDISEPGSWLLRAARNVDTRTHWHEPVEAVVQRHGGQYDGGESGWLDVA